MPLPTVTSARLAPTPCRLGQRFRLAFERDAAALHRRLAAGEMNRDHAGQAGPRREAGRAAAAGGSVAGGGRDGDLVTVARRQTANGGRGGGARTEAQVAALIESARAPDGVAGTGDGRAATELQRDVHRGPSAPARSPATAAGADQRRHRQRRHESGTNERSRQREASRFPGRTNVRRAPVPVRNHRAADGDPSSDDSVTAGHRRAAGHRKSNNRQAVAGIRAI